VPSAPGDTLPVELPIEPPIEPPPLFDVGMSKRAHAGMEPTPVAFVPEVLRLAPGALGLMPGALGPTLGALAAGRKLGIKLGELAESVEEPTNFEGETRVPDGRWLGGGGGCGLVSWWLVLPSCGRGAPSPIAGVTLGCGCGRSVGIKVSPLPCIKGG